MKLETVDYEQLKRRLASIMLLLLTCCTSLQPVPEKTQLEIRQLQTRTYDNRQGQTKRIMKAVINVLQDEGFIISNADKELGFITAKKELDVESDWAAALSLMSQGSNARYQKNCIIESSVNISEFGDKVKVRANFQKKILDNFGGTMKVHQIEDGDFYQEFFAKVDKGIFLERQRL